MAAFGTTTFPTNPEIIPGVVHPAEHGNYKWMVGGLCILGVGGCAVYCLYKRARKTVVPAAIQAAAPATMNKKKRRKNLGMLQEENVEVDVEMEQAGHITPEPKGRQVGKILVLDDVIGKGSLGTVVFKGTYERRPVAVKRLVRTHHKDPLKEVKLLIQSDQHPNVIRFYGTEEDRDFYYLALERCTCNLEEFLNNRHDLRKPNGHPSLLLMKIMRDVVCGLGYLHKLRIIHRDLKPQNILICEEPTTCAKVSDMGISKVLSKDTSSLGFATGSGTHGWRAPEQLLQGRQTYALDIFNLGCVLFFCVTGAHPFGEPSECERNIIENKLDLFIIEDMNEAKHLFNRLLRPDPESRPAASDVLYHPFFWSSENRLSFLRDTSDALEEMKDPKKANLEILKKMAELSSSYQNWKQNLHQEFVGKMILYRSYDYNNVIDLLRLIRNTLSHYRDLPPNVKVLLGTVPEELDNYFSQKRPFQKLFMQVYEIIKDHCSAETSFKKYFWGDVAHLGASVKSLSDMLGEITVESSQSGMRTCISRDEAEEAKVKCLHFLLRQLKVDENSFEFSILSSMETYGWGDSGSLKSVVCSLNMQNTEIFGFDPFYIEKGDV